MRALAPELLTECAKTKWMPHLSPILRKVGTTDACTIGFDPEVAFAPVERTLLSAAFDLDYDFACCSAAATVEERRFSAT